jgi:hypothetical protein
MQELLWARSGRAYPISTLCVTLQRHNYTTRVLRQIMIRRDAAEEATFIAAFSRFPADYFIFIDETRKDPRGLHRRCGRGIRGTRTTVRSEWGRSRSFSALGVLSLDGMIDCGITGVKGVNAELFLVMLAVHVLPHLEHYPGRNSIVVMDNASMHHDPRVRRMIKTVGAELVFLPPYANNLNPIEEAFSKAKLWLHRNRQVAEDEPEWALHEALMSVTHADAAGYFRHAGYSVEEFIPGCVYG